MTTSQTPRFEALGLIEPLLKALHTEGYTHPTPIQQQAVPQVLKGNDLLGCAQTGTGKTAAFALPILQLLAKKSPSSGPRQSLRALILTPTRELAAQIEESFKRYGSELDLSIAVIFGGVGQGAQVSALRRGVDILVATPGRLLDLMEQKHLSLDALEIFVLDEADRMLDMGFIHDVKRIIRVLPRKRQSLFFSATMPPDIQRLADSILSKPVKVEVTPVASTAEKIKQSVFFVESQEGKRGLLAHLIQSESIKRVLVFTRTKHGADRVARYLVASGISAEAIHGNKSQNNRVRALENFKGGSTRVLVATDIAARGIDIDGVSHVINFEIPNIPETYVHRIGRTARAGAAGISYSFCDNEERDFLRDIEKLIRQAIPVVKTHPFDTSVFTPKPRPPQSEVRPSAPRSRQDSTRSTPRNRQSGGSRQQNSAQHPMRGAHTSQDRQAKPGVQQRHPQSSRSPRGQRHGSQPARPQRATQSSSASNENRRPQQNAQVRPKTQAPTHVAKRSNPGTTATPATKKPWWKKVIGSK